RWSEGDSNRRSLSRVVRESGGRRHRRGDQRRGQYRLKPWSGDDPAGASEIQSLWFGCPLRLAGVFDLQLTPHPGSVIGIVALSGGTPELRVLQQLEPADDLCATLFCLHRLAWRLAIEEGKRVIEGTPVVIIQVGVDG